MSLTCPHKLLQCIAQYVHACIIIYIHEFFITFITTKTRVRSSNLGHVLSLPTYFIYNIYNWQLISQKVLNTYTYILCPQTFTMSFMLGFWYEVVLQRGQACSIIGLLPHAPQAQATARLGHAFRQYYTCVKCLFLLRSFRPLLNQQRSESLTTCCVYNQVILVYSGH